MAPPLPIESAIAEIRAALARATRVVIVAPPGAGKTTRVPVALLDEPWLDGRKIVMLEPRRLAARAAARRMASSLDGKVGGVVGYRVHLDTVVGRATRIEVVTEAVLTRMVQADPTLDGIGAVLFDEFHERSLAADLGLALTLNAQRHVRDDLRVVIMSATLESDRVARVLDAEVVRSEGRAFPVETLYRPRGERERVEVAVARVTREALAGPPGDILCFLPGGAEIRRTTEELAQTITDPRVDIRPLYGELPSELQDAAIAPSVDGRRKVVLATNIAETSLTIDGVRVVVDGGLARAPRYTARTGLTRLETVRISRASADQRRGRAGRTAPGVCYRLWGDGDDAQLAPRNVPEILEADLAPLALELAAAGIDDPNDLVWLDAPPAGALAQGRALLEQLGALERNPETGIARLTAHGADIAALPTHPRISHLIVHGIELGHGALACDLAALFANRDVLRPAQPGAAIDADVRTRLAVLAGEKAGANARVDHDAVRRVRQESAVWRDRFRVPHEKRSHYDHAGLLLSFAYPDRVAKRRNTHGRFVLANGSGAHFHEAQPLGSEGWIVIAETDGRIPESRIYLAASITLDELRTHHAGAFTTSDDIDVVDDDTVRAVRRSRFGGIVVKEQPLRDLAPELVFAALMRAVRRRGIAALPWSENAQSLRARLAFARRLDDSWPDVSNDALLASVDEWLAPVVGDARSLRDIGRADLTQALLARLDWKQRADLDTVAPTHITVPSGARIAIDYTEPGAPALRVRLQEMYGVATTPTIGGGRVPLTLHLLSPAQRPVQVTRDLAAFWRGSYAEVRKDMRGRYPKHKWPEDPLRP
ncbi:MAG TPA: ATP-dependent helicase HrpB [Gemmatimonadaceae bacterium]|nr:ATP-dependent helicase HrpB [Gemmatimonadaceae bacterium]